MKTKAKPAKSKRDPVDPDNPNRLKPGALFWITVEGERYPMHYPTRRGKLPLRKIREIIDAVVATRKKPIFEK